MSIVRHHGALLSHNKSYVKCVCREVQEEPESCRSNEIPVTTLEIPVTNGTKVSFSSQTKPERPRRVLSAISINETESLLMRLKRLGSSVSCCWRVLMRLRE
jgi:hypothetical protein